MERVKKDSKAMKANPRSRVIGGVATQSPMSLSGGLLRRWLMLSCMVLSVQVEAQAQAQVFASEAQTPFDLEGNSFGVGEAGIERSPDSFDDASRSASISPPSAEEAQVIRRVRDRSYPGGKDEEDLEVQSQLMVPIRKETLKQTQAPPPSDDEF